MVQVLYADKDILVAVKPAGVESQAAKRFAPDMVSVTVLFSTSSCKVHHLLSLHTFRAAVTAPCPGLSCPASDWTPWAPWESP